MYNCQRGNDVPLKQFTDTKLALGCDTTLTIVTKTTSQEVSRIFNMLWLEIFKFEKKFSRFLPDSELSKFNRNAGIKTEISKEFEDILRVSNEMSEKTNGYHNPFVLPALHRFGYEKSFVSKHDDSSFESHSADQIVDYTNLVVSTGFATIPKNTSIDLGGCGKGYLADKLGKIISKYKIDGFWFSIGGDIIALGNNESNTSWQLTIQDADKPTTALDGVTQFENIGFCVATSGTIVRRGKVGATNWHHIINPLTYKPAETDVRLATVLAPTTVEADVLATTAVILGSEKCLDFMKNSSAISALLQLDDINKTIIGFGELYENYNVAKNIQMVGV